MLQHDLSGQTSHYVLGVHEHKLHKLSYLLLYRHKKSDNISVRYMNDHSVFRCVVLIFILDYQSFPSIVVSFALLLSSEFHFVSLEVGLVLANFNNPHPAEQNPDSTACRRPAGPARFRGRKSPTPIFLPRKSHGQKSLAGYSLRDRKESDTT